MLHLEQGCHLPRTNETSRGRSSLFVVVCPQLAITPSKRADEDCVGVAVEGNHDELIATASAWHKTSRIISGDAIEWDHVDVDCSHCGR